MAIVLNNSMDNKQEVIQSKMYLAISCLITYTIIVNYSRRLIFIERHINHRVNL